MSAPEMNELSEREIELVKLARQAGAEWLSWIKDQLEGTSQFKSAMVKWRRWNQKLHKLSK